ncbi:MAG: ATP-binding protein [Planctomycetota bacterium]
MSGSLRTRLLTGAISLVVGFVAIALVAITLLVQQFADGTVARDLQAGQTSYERFMDLRRRSLAEKAQSLAAAPQLLDALRNGTDREHLDARLTSLRRALPESSLLAAGDDHTKFVAGWPTGAHLDKIAELPGLDHALAGRAVDRLWRFTNELMLVAVAPIHDGREVHGWLAVGLPFDSEAVDEIREVTGRDVLVLHQGTCIRESWREPRATPIPADAVHRLASLRGGERLQLDPGGTEQLVVGVSLHPQGGTLVLLRGTEEIIGLNDQVWVWLLLCGLAIAGVGIIASRHFADRLTSPLDELVAASNSLAAGNLGAEVAVRTDDEIGRLARAFNAMARRIEKLVRDEMRATMDAEHANRAKDRFLASMSHELRTPLTSVQAYAEILLSYGEDCRWEQTQEFASVIKMECDRLCDHIDRVFDFVNLSSNRIRWRLDDFDVGEVARQVIDDARGLQDEKGVNFVIDAGPTPYHGDPERIRQLLASLVHNAWKFSPPGEEVSITARRDEAGVTIEVADRGPGLQEDAKEAVFAMFHQEGDLLTDKPDGTGLGLAMAKEIVAMHGGSVCCRNRKGGGTVFEVSLPTEAGAAPRPIDATGSASTHAAVRPGG